MNTPSFDRSYEFGHASSLSGTRHGISRATQTAAILMFFVLVSGCKNDDGGLLVDCDTTPPIAGAISPTCGSTNVAINQVVTATFSEVVESATLTTSTFLLAGPGGTPVTGSVTYVSATNIATFTPATNLAPLTDYTYTIKGGINGVQDLFENVLTSDFTCAFTTGSAPDISAPTVTATDPANNMTGVMLNSVVTATFNEAMDPLTITTSSFIVRGPGSTQVSGTVTYAGPSFSAIFTPSGALAPSTLYTATVNTGSKDGVGNALAADHVWTFTTGAAVDATRPTVTSTDPADNATLVPINKIVTARFSEAMAPSTITAASFTLQNGSTLVSGSVSYTGMTATFTPTGSFEPGTTYTGTITTGATDVAGNPLADDYVWIFSTGTTLDVTAPMVVSTDPADLEIDVALDKDVTATFNESMNQSSITALSFTLKQGLVTVLGSVSYSGMTATFNPSIDFLPSTLYTGTITIGAVDLAGNPLASDYVWSFTTMAAIVPPGPLVVDLTCAAGYSVLAGATISSTGFSVINGDIAMSPGSALIGFPPGIINGVVHINDTIANNAKGCLTAAFNDAAGRAPGAAVSGNIGGLTLAPGVYTAGSGLAISSGDLTLDAQGDANGVFIFQIPTSLTVTSGRQVFLIGGAQAKNVFWQVGSSATIGTNAIMMGTIMADQAITLETGATLNGAALARIAAVTLDAATINVQ